MVSFIGEHRQVEPICQQLPIAPWIYYEQKAPLAAPPETQHRITLILDSLLEPA
jgi:hypothetical protein